jgi:hypothetical protein
MSQHGSFEPNYFSIAETHWRACQGEDVRFSSLDWAVLGACEDGGIPLEAFLWGIHRTFENARLGPQNGRLRRIRRVAYCLPEIYAAHELLVEDEVQGHGDLRKSLRRYFLGKKWFLKVKGSVPVDATVGNTDECRDGAPA